MDHAQFRACLLSRICISLIWSSDSLTFIRNNCNVLCNFSARKKKITFILSEVFYPHYGKAFFFPLLCSSVESTQWPGMKTASHEVDKRERADETSFTDEIFTMEEVRNSTEILPCLHSVPFFFFWSGTGALAFRCVPSPAPPDLRH